METVCFFLCCGLSAGCFSVGGAAKMLTTSLLPSLSEWDLTPSPNVAAAAVIVFSKTRCR